MIRKPARLGGFTLTELIVVMGIIAIVVAITLPAIQSAREAGRRVECQNKLRQLGVAFENFAGTHRIYPTNGGPVDGNWLTAVDGKQVKPSTTDFHAGGTSYFGVGSNKFSPNDQPGPWCYQLFHSMELGHLRAKTNFVDLVPDFLCASRGRLPSLPTVTDRYGAYESGGHAMAKTDFAANFLVVGMRGQPIGPQDISDGLSQTILLGEKAYNAAVQTPTSWYYDEPIWLGGSHGTVRNGTVLLPDSHSPPHPQEKVTHYREHWGSPHADGVFFLFADGHVEFISMSISDGLLRTALTPADADQYKPSL